MKTLSVFIFLFFLSGTAKSGGPSDKQCVHLFSKNLTRKMILDLDKKVQKGLVSKSTGVLTFASLGQGESAFVQVEPFNNEDVFNLFIQLRNEHNEAFALEKFASDFPQHIWYFKDRETGALSPLFSPTISLEDGDRLLLYSDKGELSYFFELDLRVEYSWRAEKLLIPKQIATEEWQRILSHSYTAVLYRDIRARPEDYYKIFLAKMEKQTKAALKRYKSDRKRAEKNREKPPRTRILPKDQ